MSRGIWWRYSLFALIATGVNLLTQWGVFSLTPSRISLAASIMAGTLTGLLIKYWLDKRYIFGFVTQNYRHDVRLFLIYTLMGLFTTVIFWGTELLFHRLLSGDGWRYLGGALGLALGYYCKYRLDKRFVFVE